MISNLYKKLKAKDEDLEEGIGQRDREDAYLRDVFNKARQEERAKFADWLEGWLRAWFTFENIKGRQDIKEIEQKIKELKVKCL